MFTGLITDIGTLRHVSRKGPDAQTYMEVTCAYDIDMIDIGASISHAGACMTVTEKGIEAGAGWYGFDVSDESLSKTVLASWKVGQKINLERALTGADELGGHLVSGHVDGVGTLIGREDLSGSLKLDFRAPKDIGTAIAPKGSIAIDGVSLTVNTASDIENGTDFSVNIIPHTAEFTTLGELQPGDDVNLEIDMIARYVARYLSAMKAKT